jgi:DNA-directed RNA polymerase subunit H
LPSKAFKVTDHIYVPKHEILSKEEAKKIIRRYNATLEQLPYILSTDPVVVEIGAKPGDIIKITRKSETAGEAVYYRLVVEG